MQNSRHQWSSQLGFILAASGAAVGLGNIWKFPYMAGQYGGGAFVIVYLLAVFLVGAPIMMAEIMLGRRGRANPVDTMRNLAIASNKSQNWLLVGLSGIIIGALILSYYSVIAGCSLDYVYQSAAGHFTHASSVHINHLYQALVSNPWKLLLFHSIIMAITVYIIARGVNKGIELVAKLLFPLMLILLAVLIIYAYHSSHFAEGLHFLFKPDFSKLTGQGVLAAFGQALFTLSVAIGSLMIYGSYLPKHVSIVKVSLIVVCIDTLVALCAGLAIFPVVFQHGLEPAAGPGLIFQTLPLAFGHMPFGRVMATLFFIMLCFAAITSTISLLEPSVSWLIERTRLKRYQASLMLGFIIWFIGIGTVLSFNVWQHSTLFGKTFFGLLDYLTANIMIPLTGLFMMIFVGWRLKRNFIKDDWGANKGFWFKLWLYDVKFFVPICIVIIFISVL